MELPKPLAPEHNPYLAGIVFGQPGGMDTAPPRFLAAGADHPVLTTALALQEPHESARGAQEPGGGLQRPDHEHSADPAAGPQRR